MYYKSPLTYLIPLLFIIMLFANLQIVTEQQFVSLAKSFNSGSLSFINMGSNISDHVFFNNQYYWPLGPFPALLIMPFVYFTDNFFQGFISFPLAILNFYLLYKIAKKFNLNNQKSLLLAIFFVFGSIFTPLAALPASWYFAQIVATTSLILAIFVFLTNKNYLLIGIFVSFAIATRLNLITSIIFFSYYLIKKPIKPKNIALFVIPIAFTLILLGVYNYARFQNPFESGYKMQIIPEEPQARRDVGLFSIKHIPPNLFYMLFKGPEPVLKDSSHLLKPPFITFNNYGLSLFFLSPVLFLIFKANYKKEIVKVSTITTLIIIIPLITYYGIGQKQVGYRYALDFFPFIYLILATAVKKTNIKLLVSLVMFGVFFSTYFTFLYFFGFDL